MDAIYNDAVDRYLKMVKTAQDHNSKELRLPIKDAEMLSTGIALLLSRDLRLTQKVMELQDRLLQTAPAEPDQVNLNGGGF